VESLEKVVPETDGNDHSSTMILCEEHDLHETILEMPAFTIDSTPNSQICTFGKALAHIVENCPYRCS